MHPGHQGYNQLQELVVSRHQITMMGHINVRLVMFCALLLGVAGHSHHRRDLQGQVGNSAAENKANNGKRNRNDGKMFDFSTVGGAASFLAKMDKDQLQRIMDKAGWSKGIGGLAKQLDEDLDFVSRSSCVLSPSSQELEQNFLWRGHTTC